jgi:hypothetical protein
MKFYYDRKDYEFIANMYLNIYAEEDFAYEHLNYFNNYVLILSKDFNYFNTNYILYKLKND